MNFEVVGHMPRTVVFDSSCNFQSISVPEEERDQEEEQASQSPTP